MIRFLNIREPGAAEIVPAIVRNGAVHVLPDIVPDGLDGLIEDGRINSSEFLAETEEWCTGRKPYPVSLDTILGAKPGGENPWVELPLSPAEVWGVGVSYKKAAQLHEEDIKESGLIVGLYDYVYNSKRPEIFFKGLARHCVGHNRPFGLRWDSSGTMVEAELACIFGANGQIVAYSIANDITAWDIEKDCPLFLNYAKIFLGGCALGPYLVPASQIDEPLSLDVECVIVRGGKEIYRGTGNTSDMKRNLGELSHYLNRCNDIPPRTVLCTGTAVGIPNDLVMKEGDVVTITFERLGRLENMAKRLSKRD